MASGRRPGVAPRSTEGRFSSPDWPTRSSSLSSTRGNPLPVRALSLIAEANGMVLHLSGGGTAARQERVVELDGALFDSTDVIGDAHQLPFPADHFDLVVADELLRALPGTLGGSSSSSSEYSNPEDSVFVRTAFLQPLHEAPDHDFNAAKHGVETMVHRFETVSYVSDNFHPGLRVVLDCLRHRGCARS